MITRDREEGSCQFFVRSYVDHIVHGIYRNEPVAGKAGMGTSDDGLRNLFYLFVGNNEFYPDMDGIGVSNPDLLAEPPNLAHGHTPDTRGFEALHDILDGGRTHYGHNGFHVLYPLKTAKTG